MGPHIYRTYRGLLDIGEILIKMDEPDQVEMIEHLKETHHEKLPDNELVASYLDTKQTPSLQTFLGIFMEDVQHLDEAEKAWPMASGLQY